MDNRIPRRDFLAVSALGTAGLLAPWTVRAAQFKTKLHKAMIMGKPTEEGLRKFKDAGFEGIECRAWNATPEQAAAGRVIAEKVGMRIHSVMRGWANFNNPGAVDKDIASVETAIAAAKGYGADAILLVPCRISGMPMPKAWEFDIEFDPATCHLTRVAKGDNAPYQKYIEAHNQATDATRAALARLIPAAEKAGVVITIENVWNNLWVQPKIFAAFIRSINSPWVKAYFDIGNHVKYAMPELWIRALGDLLVKCHVKDFKLNPNGQGGKWANFRDGSVDWVLVRRELDAIGYNGWLTIEGSGGLSLQEKNKRMDLILAGR